LNNRNATHEELVLQFLGEVEGILKEIKDKNNQLKKAKDYDERTQAHNTRNLLKKFIRLEELKY